jgi:hypothetical protein
VLVAAVAPAVLAVVVTSIPATAATRDSALVRGTVVCASGRPVVGVTMETTTGGALAASWAAMPGRPHVAFFSRRVPLADGASVVRPAVGCGGDASAWASTSRPAPLTVTAPFVFNVRCSDPAAGDGTCLAGGVLAWTKSSNTFYRGYCTWGAAELWRKATGTYPAWSGNANRWATNAASLGFTVTDVPQARALMVSPYGSAGHVAWVTRVWVESGVTYYRVREMNWVGWNVWSTRTVKHDPAFRFIVAPAGRSVTRL